MLAGLNVRRVPAVTHIDEAFVLARNREYEVALALIAVVLAVVDAEVDTCAAVAGLEVCGSIPRLVHQIVSPHIAAGIGIPACATGKQAIVDVAHFEQRSSFKAASFQLNDEVGFRLQIVGSESLNVGIAIHIRRIDMIGSTVGIYEDCLVARITAIGAEYIYEGVGTFDLISCTYSTFGLAVVAAVLPMNPHHPFTCLLVIDHLRTFERTAAGYVAVFIGLGACGRYSTTQFCPRIKVAAAVATDTIALAVVSLLAKPIVLTVMKDYTSTMGIDGRTIYIIPGLTGLEGPLPSHREGGDQG